MSVKLELLATMVDWSQWLYVTFGMYVVVQVMKEFKQTKSYLAVVRDVNNEDHAVSTLFPMFSIREMLDRYTEGPIL
jgi:hypothetical protein